MCCKQPLHAFAKEPVEEGSNWNGSRRAPITTSGLSPYRIPRSGLVLSVFCCVFVGIAKDLLET